MKQVPDKRHWQRKASELISDIQSAYDSNARQDILGILALKLELIFREGILHGLDEVREVLKS